MLLVALVIVNAYMLNVEEEGQNTETREEPQSAAEYFEERMVTLGIEDVGHPIEGFDANLLMGAYPGLEPEDFAGVAAFEGRYSVEDGELVFTRDEDAPLSSAERTVISEGYATLLHNVTERLNVPAGDHAAVDDLIERINTGERLETRIDQGASALDVRVVPLEVLEDSRCPVDVTCVQAGTVRVRATLESGLGTGEEDFTLNEPITTEAEEVTLVEVTPEPQEGVEIDPSEYVFYFSVIKRDDV